MSATNHQDPIPFDETDEGDFQEIRSAVDFHGDDQDLGNVPHFQSENLDRDQDKDQDKDRIVMRGLYRLGKVHYDKADLDKAKEYFERSLNLSFDPQDEFFKFKILGFLIRIHSEKQNQVEVQKFINQSKDLFNSWSLISHFSHSPAEYFYFDGTIKNYENLRGQARASFIKSVQLSREENNPEILAKSLFALSSSNYQEGKFEDALFELVQLDELLKIIPKLYFQGAMHLLMGNIYGDMGGETKALYHYREAHKALLQKSCWNLHGYVLLGQGRVYKKKGEFNKSLIYFDLAFNSINSSVFKTLAELLENEISDVNDSSVVLSLDRTNRLVYEEKHGVIDFKHRFVLLEILFLLAQKPGKFFDKELLAKTIWHDEYNPLIHDKLIYTSVSRLRKLIEPKGTRRKYIIRGKDGYTFNQNVKIRILKESQPGANLKMANIDLSSPV